MKHKKLARILKVNMHRKTTKRKIKHEFNDKMTQVLESIIYRKENLLLEDFNAKTVNSEIREKYGENVNNDSGQRLRELRPSSS